MFTPNHKYVTPSNWFTLYFRNSHKTPLPLVHFNSLHFYTEFRFFCLPQHCLCCSKRYVIIITSLNYKLRLLHIRSFVRGFCVVAYMEYIYKQYVNLTFSFLDRNTQKTSDSIHLYTHINVKLAYWFDFINKMSPICMSDIY